MTWHGLPASYDDYLAQGPPEGPELPVCPICGEEGYPGRHCRDDECDHYFPTESDLREEADERRAEAILEARWDDDPRRETW